MQKQHLPGAPILFALALSTAGLPAQAQFNAALVSAGSTSTCAATASGTLNCWGYSSQGQIGNGDHLTLVTSPVVVRELAEGVKSVSAGSGSSTCAVTRSGAAKCWGLSAGGLGDGVNRGTGADLPVQLLKLTSGVASISVGTSFVCALMDTGGVTCFGNNDSGQLGHGDAGSSHIPTGWFAVGLESGVKQLSVGSVHACVLTNGGAVKCWGNNLYGQLGDGTTTNRRTPIDVPGLSSGVTAIATAWYHTCALMQAGTVKCWGINEEEEVTPGNTLAITSATDIPGITNATLLAPGRFHTCAALASGGIKCWGGNGNGQIGDGSYSRRSLPVSVAGITGRVTALSSGSGHTCANVEGSGLSCWGYGYFGQLGNGAQTEKVATPARVGPAKFTPSYQGLWWRAPAGSESGWGVSIAQQGDILFAAWFTYDEQRNGMWLVMTEGRKDANGRYSGTLYRTRGPVFTAVPWNPAQVSLTPVGIVSFRFSSANDGFFQYTLGGVTVEKPIVRQVFSPLAPTCEIGGDAGVPNYTDLWWRSPAGSESGWGVSVNHQGDTIFAVWYTYGADGNGQWLVLSNGQRTAPGVYEGSLYRTTGPAYSAQPWNGIEVVATAVGYAKLTFTGTSEGTFEYTLGDVTQVKPITRQVYASTVTVCR